MPAKIEPRLIKVSMMEGSFSHKETAPKLRISISGEANSREWDNGYELRCDLSVAGTPENQKRQTLKIRGVFLVRYVIENYEGPTELTSEVVNRGIADVWPYFCEFVSNATNRMGLPTLFLGNASMVKATPSKSD